MSLAQVVALLTFLDTLFKLGGKLIEAAARREPALLPAIPDVTRGAWAARARALNVPPDGARAPESGAREIADEDTDEGGIT